MLTIHYGSSETGKTQAVKKYMLHRLMMDMNQQKRLVVFTVYPDQWKHIRASLFNYSHLEMFNSNYGNIYNALIVFDTLQFACNWTPELKDWFKKFVDHLRQQNEVHMISNYIISLLAVQPLREADQVWFYYNYKNKKEQQEIDWQTILDMLPPEYE